MSFVHSWSSACFASMVLQVEASATERLVCTGIGNNMASLMEREATMPAKASARPFSTQGTPAGWIAPDVLLLGIAGGALPRILMIGRLHRLTKSTILLRLVPCVGWAFRSILARSQPLLGLSWTIWVGTRFQIRSILWPIVAFFRLSLVCAECCEGVGQLERPPGGLGNRGGASRRHFEELRPLVPYLNIRFLRPPMLC
ncbi:hypothetical protein CK203_022439 [Vitis vinifera]|uniref:Secreted protein n=1 Tax=Vitis vinifera TaxID=29760 RepID=A0A438I975_VITVI|nr:hypothetical protein CK203_022439 [Vitis vinifera]